MNHSFSFLSAAAPFALLVASASAQSADDPFVGAALTAPPILVTPAPATDDPAYGVGGGNALTMPRTTNFLGTTSAIDFVAGSGSCGTNSNQSIGWQFNVTSPITVNQMSWFDEAGNGLGVSHQVGIWTPGGTLIASTNVTIPAGTAATLNGGWRSVNITPTVLPIGSGYIVGGYNGSGSTDCLSFNVTQTVHPDITYIDATFSGINGIFERPTSFSAANNGFYGVGFRIDTGCQPANGVDFIAGSGLCGTNSNQSIGWQFNVTSPITVNRMSWFDEGGNGLSVAHQVGIWNPAGTLIASTNVTIPSGTAATLDGNYRTVAIPATVLPVGNGYIVGGYNGSGSTDCLSFNVTQTPHPNITYIDATFSGINGIFERPANFSGAVNGFYGVGFQTDGGCTPCLSADGLEDNDICTQAVLLGNGQINNLTCQKFDWDYYRAVVNPGGTLQVDILFVDNLGDMDLFLYTSLANCQTNENVQSHGCGGTVSCGFSTSDNETASYFNNTGSPVTVWIEVNLWFPTPFDCNDYSLVISGARENAIACDPAASHSGGTYAKLNTSSTSGPGVLHLECTDGPPSNFGYFLVSGTLVDPGNPVSNGFLCLGAPIGRYAPAAGGALNSVGQFNAAGRLQNLAGTSSNGFGYDVMPPLPSPPGGVIQPGSTWYFQCWYRDGNRSNFSNVFCKTF